MLLFAGIDAGDKSLEEKCMDSDTLYVPTRIFRTIIDDFRYDVNHKIEGLKDHITAKYQLM